MELEVRVAAATALLGTATHILETSEASWEARLLGSTLVHEVAEATTSAAHLLREEHLEDLVRIESHALCSSGHATHPAHTARHSSHVEVHAAGEASWHSTTVLHIFHAHAHIVLPALFWV